MRASEREGCAMIDVKRKIDVLPGIMICMNERRPEIEIVDDDCFEPPRAAIDSPVTNLCYNLLLYQSTTSKFSILSLFAALVYPNN